MTQNIKKGEKWYEGKAKILYHTDNPDWVIQYFKDDATAFNNQKKGSIQDKGVMNCEISSRIFKFLQHKDIPTHFGEQLSEREMLVKKAKILPLEVVMRNVIAGSLSKRTGRPEGEVLKHPIMELYYKDDDLGDPMINHEHVKVFEWANGEEMQKIEQYGHQINNILTTFFENLGIRLVDFKLEFGVDNQGMLVLADEITPDGCRLWDLKTDEKLDKDRFRRDLGNIEESYGRVLNAVREATKD